MLAATWGVGQVLWSLIWFFLFFLWIMLVINVFGDIIRDRSLSGGGKALWTIVIIVVPYLGVFVYLIARGGGMAERQIERAQQSEQAFRSYVQQTATTGSTAQDLATLADLHAKGVLSDAEFAAQKAKLLA
ncbi:MAG: SHOCT domain-containing protein [Ilumatobacteraceae bacterium]|jgi:hypothetical protein